MTELIEPPPDTAITDLDLASSMSQPLAPPHPLACRKRRGESRLALVHTIVKNRR